MGLRGKRHIVHRLQRDPLAGQCAADAEPERRSTGARWLPDRPHDNRILILLLMVAAVTVADDPILVLGPALAKQLHASPAWSGWFIAALGAGTVSFVPPVEAPAHYPARGNGTGRASPVMLIFVFAPSCGSAVAAALGAGAAA